jgi:periplasmic divalent cation tolerance protein
VFQENGEIRVIISTCASMEEGRRISAALVEEGLVACVNLLGGVESVYRWQGKVETSTEVLLMMKTTIARQSEALARLKALHPYDVPEGIVLPVLGGLAEYLGWVSASTSGDYDSLG